MSESSQVIKGFILSCIIIHVSPQHFIVTPAHLVIYRYIAPFQSTGHIYPSIHPYTNLSVLIFSSLYTVSIILTITHQHSTPVAMWFYMQKKSLNCVHSAQVVVCIALHNPRQRINYSLFFPFNFRAVSPVIIRPTKKLPDTK